MMDSKEYYSYTSNLRAMYETIGNYHQREYAIFTEGRAMVRWLYLPKNFYSASAKVQFPVLKPDKYYYGIAHLDWENSGCYYRMDEPHMRFPAYRAAIKDKCNTEYEKMVLGFDCAIDIDSHDNDISIQENTDRAAVVASAVAFILNEINANYILCYSGRGFSFRIPWDASMLQLGSPFEVRELMFWWVEDMKDCAAVKGINNGASIDNIMSQDKRVSKVPFSYIQYYESSTGEPSLSTYAKRITSDELINFKIPEPHALRGEHLRFKQSGDYAKLVEELRYFK